MVHLVHNHFELFSEIKIDSKKFGRELEALIARNRNVAETKRPENISGATAATTQIIRKDQKNFGESDIAAFKNAINKLIEDGVYRTIIEIHADMSHNMHGSMGVIGLLRFLSWHRRYLLAFEEELQNADRSLRPQEETPISIPYWRWVDPFPEWLEGWLPAPDPRTSNPVPPRTLSPPGLKPTANDVDFIINGYEQQLPGVNVDAYTRFTFGLEGFGRRADNTNLPAHNQVHAWVGGIMNNTSYSPTDPIFWLHHAEVDRLWHIWQKQNPGLNPVLTGNDRVMDPWQETIDQLTSITVLGYNYDSETL